MERTHNVLLRNKVFWLHVFCSQLNPLLDVPPLLFLLLLFEVALVELEAQSQSAGGARVSKTRERERMDGGTHKRERMAPT